MLRNFPNSSGQTGTFNENQHFLNFPNAICVIKYFLLMVLAVYYFSIMPASGWNKHYSNYHVSLYWAAFTVRRKSPDIAHEYSYLIEYFMSSSKERLLYLNTLSFKNINHKYGPIIKTKIPYNKWYIYVYTIILLQNHRSVQRINNFRVTVSLYLIIIVLFL